MGPILIPPPKKNPETWVKFVENRVKNHGKNFGKWVYSLSKSWQNRSTNMVNFFPENRLGFFEGPGPWHIIFTN